MEYNNGRTKYIKFNADKEHKILSFTGKVDTLEIPANDFETGLEIPGRYAIRYFFECYDITTLNQQGNNNNNNNIGSPTIWERGPKDAKTILYYLSKDIRELEIVRNEAPGSKTTTYLINPPLD